MPAQMVVELPGGNKVVFGGSGRDTGLSEAAFGEAVAKATGEKFKAALGALADLVAVLEGSLGEMARRPDKVEMEFGASLTGDCNLWIVSGEGQAEFKVTLAWEKK
jgi:hypothetical protein